MEGKNVHGLNKIVQVPSVQPLGNLMNIPKINQEHFKKLNKFNFLKHY